MMISPFRRERRTAQGIQKRLIIIETLIFVLPFLIIFYLFYEKGFFFQYNDLTIITLIFVLVLGGLVFLRQIFDRVLAIADSIRRAAAGEIAPIDVRNGADQLKELSLSFNSIMERMERTTEKLDQKVVELMAIKELYEVARKSFDIEALLDITLEKAMMVTGAKIGSLVVLEKGTQQYLLSLTKGMEKDSHKDRYIDMDASALKYVISAKKPLLIADIEQDPRTQKPNDPRYGSPSFMSLPVLIENNVAAILNLANKGTGKPFSDTDQQSTSVMLEEISFALENAHLHAKIKDHLTEIEAQNRLLEQEIAVRKEAEEKLRRAQDELEQTVEVRTAELVTANEALRLEIAERVRAEQILRESEEKYRLHFSNVSDVIYSLSPDMTFMNVSPSIERLLGYLPEEIIGQSLWQCDIFVPSQREMAIADVMRTMDGEMIKPASYELRGKDGTKKVVEVSSTPVICDQEIKAVIFVARDITERKRLESELLQAIKLEAIGTLAGGIAHDFNNVLTGIQGHASLMLFNADESHAHHRHLKSIEEQVKSGANLTRQLLGFARGGKLEVKPTNLNEVVYKTADMFGRTRKDIVFNESYQDGLWTVEADQGQMEQVLMNLFVNASQAMPEGGEIRLTTENIIHDEITASASYVTPGKYVVLTVADSGIGMDEKTRERIFEPFFTTKEVGKSTGLGLSSAYGIVKGHGGFITVVSDKGRGAAFSISLPVSDKEIVPGPAATENLCRGSETILLVEDEESVTSVCRNMLETLGYRVLVAKSGEEAVALYRKNNQEIDMVVMDMIMPGMGGEHAFDQLKEIDPGVRVIMSTGYSTEDREAHFLERGCKGLLQKPFRLPQLSQKIRAALDGSAGILLPSKMSCFSETKR